jgi:MFS family permease
VYQAESVRLLLDRSKRGAGLRGLGPGRRTVVLLGITSLFTDIASEMVAAVLPLYLIFGVGLSPLQFGVVDGIQNGAAGIARLVGGGTGDRLRRHKAVAAVGYGLSAFTRMAMIFANTFAGISAIVFTDRVGKGIRTAPRDALISLAVPREKLGTAFGVHRALDTCGAMLGPLVAFAILSLSVDNFDSVFVVAFAAAMIGLLVIVLLVEPDRRHVPSGPKLTFAAAVDLIRIPRFRALSLAGTALSIATISDAFIYLELQDALNFDFRYLPLFYFATALAFMLLALPFGILADRIGRGKVFVGGYVLLLGVYALLLYPHGTLTIVLLAPLFGAYYAATDGVLAAASGAVLPENARGTGLAFVGTVTNLGRFAASVAFGAMWVAFGATEAIAIFGVALVIALVFAATILHRTETADA